MKDNKKSMLLAWLNDAYAMEQGLVEVLEGHSQDAKGYPEVKKKIEEHLKETKEHVKKVKKCVESLGGDVSEIKAGLAKIMSAMNSAISHMPSDKIVKNAIAEFSAEHMEIASYAAIISAAEELGEDDVADKCREILEDEERTADWLEENLPTLVSEFLASPELEE